MIGSLVLPALYGKYQAEQCNCLLRIVEGGRGTLMEGLKNHQIDMALLPHDTPLPQFETKRVGTMETMCCVSRGHPLRGNQSVSVSDLADEPLVLFSDSFFQTEQILNRFQSAGKKKSTTSSIN